MENKSSLKYYLLGAAGLIVVIIIIILLVNSKPAQQKPQTGSTLNTPIASIAATPVASVTNTPNVSTSATPVVNSTSANGLIGTWVSAVQGKGMQGSGKIAISGTATQITFTGDVNLVVQKVENNTGTGEITFTNLCGSKVTSVPGKPDVIGPAQCISGNSLPAVMRINGNTITYTGKSILGADISLTGTYTNDSMSGTFTRTSASGNITGTFNLARAKN